MKRANIREVIRQMGGAARLAAGWGVSVAAVYAWGRDNSMPLDRADMLASTLDIDRDLLHDPWRGRCPEVMSEEETRALFNRG